MFATLCRTLFFFFSPGHTSRVKIFERYAGKTLLRMLDSRTSKNPLSCGSCLPTKNLPHFKNAYTTFPRPLFARVDLQRTPCQLPCRRLTTGRLLGGDNCAGLQKLPAVCIADDETESAYQAEGTNLDTHVSVRKSSSFEEMHSTRETNAFLPVVGERRGGTDARNRSLCIQGARETIPVSALSKHRIPQYIRDQNAGARGT